MDGDAPARRAAARRLPDAVSRLRPRSRRPARVPVSRRRPAHRLERDRAPADAVRARVQRGSRRHRVVPARPQPVGRLRLGRRATSARSRSISSPCSRACSRATAIASAPSFYGDTMDTVIPARSGRRPRAAHPASDAAAAARAPIVGDRPQRVSARRVPGDLAPLAGVHRVGFHQRRPAGTEALAQLAQRHEVIAVRLYDPLENGAARSRLAGDAGCRNRRAALRRHARPRLSQALRAGGASAREEALRSAFRAAGVDALELCHRRRSRRRDPALRRYAQAPQPPRGGVARPCRARRRCARHDVPVA